MPTELANCWPRLLPEAEATIGHHVPPDIVDLCERKKERERGDTLAKGCVLKAVNYLMAVLPV